MGIEGLLWIGVKLQDEFYVRKMIPQASVYGSARIGKVLGQTQVGRPLALAKVITGS